MQFQGKLMNQTCENGKKIILGIKTVGPDFGRDFGPDFGSFGLNSGRQFLSFSFAKI